MGAWDVFAPILQDVQERVPDLARRSERMGMIAIGPDWTATGKRAVDRLGDPDRQALSTAREPRRPIRLQQQVEMIGLDTVVEETEVVSRGGGERAADRGEEPLAT